MVGASKTAFSMLLLSAIAASLFVYFSSNSLAEHTNIYTQGRYLKVNYSVVRGTIPLDSIMIEQATIFNLDRNSEYWPSRRIRGSSSMRFGLYELGNGSEAIVDIRGGGRAIHIPTKKGADLLIRTEHNPQIILNRIKQAIDQNDDRDNSILEINY